LDLSGVIVAGDELALLKESLPAAVDACRGVDHEILVIDNASRDGTEEWVTSSFPDVRLSVSATRLGLSSARNIGLKETTGDYVLFIDADANLRKDTPSTLLDFMSSNDGAGIAGPKLLYPDGRLQESCRTFQTWGGFLRRGLGLGLPARDQELLTRAREGGGPMNVDWVMGACQIVSRRAIRDVGPMDEQFQLYYGDVEWCHRMRVSGREVWYAPQAVCVHRYGRRSAGLLPKRSTFTHFAEFLRFNKLRAARQYCTARPCRS